MYGNLEFLDIITILSFLLQVSNHDGNTINKNINDAINTVVKDMHNSIDEQNKKLDKILAILSERS